MSARALGEIAREPVAIDRLAKQYQIQASPVKECFVPRWDAATPSRSVLASDLLAAALPEEEAIGPSSAAAIAAFVLVPAGLIAAASCGQGPLAPVWHWLFG